jgi:hypothetical protein
VAAGSAVRGRESLSPGDRSLVAGGNMSDWWDTVDYLKERAVERERYEMENPYT